MKNSTIHMKDLVREILKKKLVKKNDNIREIVETVIKEVFSTILYRLSVGNAVKIKNFGTFKAKYLKGRILKTPIMKDGKVSINDQHVIRFKQSLNAKKRLNKYIKCHIIKDEWSKLIEKSI
jgi:nucleoid DNA-binding protein